MKQQAISLLVLALLFAPPALADVYRWTDPKGTIHFTEDASAVPSEHRAQASERQWASGDPPRFQQYPQHASVGAALLGRVVPGAIRVPFTREGNLILLKVRLNDRVEAPFYLDTGASGIVIPQDVAAELGFVNDSETPRINVTTLSGNLALPTMELGSVQLGSLRVANLTGMVTSTTRVGLLGGSFFSHFSYAVDPVAKVLILHPIRN